MGYLRVRLSTGLFACILLCMGAARGFAVTAPANFLDNFEASSFDPFWTVAQQQGGAISLCGGQNHTPGGKPSACFNPQGFMGQ